MAGVRSGSRVLLLAAGLQLASCGEGGPEPGLAAPELRIELAIDRPVILTGANPQWSAYLVNDGAEPATIVLPGLPARGHQTVSLRIEHVPDLAWRDDAFTGEHDAAALARARSAPGYVAVSNLVDVEVVE